MTVPPATLLKRPTLQPAKICGAGGRGSKQMDVRHVLLVSGSPACDIFLPLGLRLANK
jgi:hypothetical protein